MFILIPMHTWHITWSAFLWSSNSTSHWNVLCWTQSSYSFPPSVVFGLLHNNFLLYCLWDFTLIMKIRPYLLINLFLNKINYIHRIQYFWGDDNQRVRLNLIGMILLGIASTLFTPNFTIIYLLFSFSEIFYTPLNMLFFLMTFTIIHWSLSSGFCSIPPLILITIQIFILFLKRGFSRGTVFIRVN